MINKSGGSFVLVALGGVLASGCSSGAEDVDQVMDRDIPKSITQPLYGGNTVDDTTTATGIIGATAKLNINGATCSGTLVTPTKIVTASHCFKCTNVFTAAGVSVTFAQGGGTFTLAQPPAIYAGSNTCNNPDAFDFAVVTLSTPVPATVATPQALFLGDPYAALTDNSLQQPCTAVGFGGNVKYDSGTGSGTRRVGSLVPQYYNDPCGDVCEGPCYDNSVWRTDLTPTHAVTAKGDSGGGLFCTLNSTPILIGVVSGYSTIDNLCNTEYNAIWSPTSGVASVRDFLIQQIGFADVAPLASFAVYSKNTVLVNDRAAVVTASGSQGAAIAAGAGAHRLGTDTFVGNVFANATVAVADRARINGTLTANGNILPGNQVQGTFVKYRYSPLPAWDLPITFPTLPAAAVTLGQNVKRTIGSEMVGMLIKSVTVDQGANLTLSCGTTYFIDTLTINAGGRVSVDTSCGPARIFVKSKIIINNGELVDTNTTVIGDILLGYAGTTTVTPGAFYGTIVAPKAKVAVSNGVSFLGAIFAYLVEIHQDSAVIHYPFTAPWLAP